MIFILVTWRTYLLIPMIVSIIIEWSSSYISVWVSVFAIFSEVCGISSRSSGPRYFSLCLILCFLIRNIFILLFFVAFFFLQPQCFGSLFFHIALPLPFFFCDLLQSCAVLKYVIYFTDHLKICCFKLALVIFRFDFHIH